MKKSTIVSLVVALIMIFIGGAMIIVSASKGGALEAQRIVDESKINIPKINIESSQINTVSFDNNEEIIKGDTVKQVKANEVSSLSVDIGGAKITINDSEDEYIYINISDMNSSQIFVDNDTLHIISKNNSLDSGEVILSIPATTVFDDVSLNVGASSMEGSAFACENFDLNLGAGEAIIFALTVSDSAIINVGAGNLNIASASLSNLTADVGLGNLDFTGTIRGDLDADCGMGNATFNFRDSAKDHNFDLSADMGNIKFDGKDYSGFSSHAGQNNNSDSIYTVQCGMGNIDINFAK